MCTVQPPGSGAEGVDRTGMIGRTHEQITRQAPRDSTNLTSAPQYLDDTENEQSGNRGIGSLNV